MTTAETTSFIVKWLLMECLVAILCTMWQHAAAPLLNHAVPAGPGKVGRWEGDKGGQRERKKQKMGKVVGGRHMTAKANTGSDQFLPFLLLSLVSPKVQWDPLGSQRPTERSGKIIAGAYARARGQMCSYLEMSFSSQKSSTGYSGRHNVPLALPCRDLCRIGMPIRSSSISSFSIACSFRNNYCIS